MALWITPKGKCEGFNFSDFQVSGKGERDGTILTSIQYNLQSCGE